MRPCVIDSGPMPCWHRRIRSRTERVTVFEQSRKFSDHKHVFYNFVHQSNRRVQVLRPLVYLPQFYTPKKNGPLLPLPSPILIRSGEDEASDEARGGAPWGRRRLSVVMLVREVTGAWAWLVRRRQYCLAVGLLHDAQLSPPLTPVPSTSFSPPPPC